MTRTDTDDFARLFASRVPLLDVRAPVEFARGALPGAVNLPLLSDAERHAIGLCYRQHGQAAAIALGHRLVSGVTRDQRIDAWRSWCRANPQGYIYCFRGGLRSQIVREWLAEAGHPMPVVRGGYKAARRFLLASIDDSLAQLDLILLCGRTGSGKTRLIEALPNALDLEALARHRGSAFGRRPSGQPTQIDFEHAIAVALLELAARSGNGRTSVVVEDEGRLIGRCHLPDALQRRMNAARQVLIDEPLESRVELTLADYVIAPLTEYASIPNSPAPMDALQDALTGALDRIRRRLGGERYATLRRTLDEAFALQRSAGDPLGHRAWIRRLLVEYYDPMYDYHADRRRADVVFSGSRAAVQRWLAAQSVTNDRTQAHRR
jgi:tRNA 2-selenouridine synthase